MAEQKKKHIGRPKRSLDVALIEKLASIQCTDTEIAAVLGVPLSTLTTRKGRDKEFASVFEKGRENGKASLRRIQFKLAEHSAAMAIWLGKNYLGQSDSFDITAKEPIPIRVCYE